MALRTVYLDEALVPAAPEGCRVFGVAALAREMTLEAMRWGPGAASGEVARRFFAALAALAAQWAAVPGRFVLPRAKTAELERAMAFVLERLEGGEAPSLDEAAAAAGVSRRTLTRRFRHEARTSFVGFVRAARMMRAMELLDRPGARVTEVAYDVGFESLGAFTRAFEAFVGELPSDYRRRAAEASTSP